MNYNQLIDHTLLKADASYEAIEKLAHEAKLYQFKSVCVNPHFVPLCASLLKDSGVEVCTVIGFPLGQNRSDVKLFETQTALKEGATEIDMVINISELKKGNDQFIVNEIKALKEACGSKTLKVIIETCLLTDQEKVKACQLAKQAGADFVKTSTGFSSGGATVNDVALMRQTVGPNMGVKASGGVRSLDDLKAMVKAGATRIGTSSGVKLVTATTDSGSNY